MTTTKSTSAAGSVLEPVDTPVTEPVSPAPPAKGSPKLKRYVHIICNTEMELPAETAVDMAESPERYLSLPCSTCGGAFRIGEDGEMLWAGTQDPVTV